MAQRTLARRPVLLVAAVIAAVTAFGALTGALVPELAPGRTPHRTLHGTLGEAAVIALQNASTLIVALALCAGRWSTHRLTRRLGDVIVTAIVVFNALLVGVALGRYSTQLLAYLPHLPLEDVALSTAAAAWLTHRRGEFGRPRRSVARYAAVTAALTALAALVETYAVPHKG